MHYKVTMQGEEEDFTTMGVYGVIPQRPGVRLEPLAVITTVDRCERQGLKGTG